MATSRKGFAIIGAGPSGIAAHLELLKQGVKPDDIIHLEAEDHVGGKCYTYHYLYDPSLMTEMGATWVASNYHEIINLIHQYRIETERVLANHSSGIPFTEDLAKKTAIEKLKTLTEMFAHMYAYTREAEHYQKIIQSKEKMPDDFDLPFALFAEKYHMKHMIDILKPIVSGFNYRSMEEVPAHSVFSYTGKTMAWELFATTIGLGQPFQGVREGYQYLMEKISANFGIITEAKISEIKRNNREVKIVYKKGNETHSVTADKLIIATSPLKWTQLRMELSDVEKDCLTHLKYSRYPVAAVLIKGISAEQHFYRDAFEHVNFAENLGEIALITTRDNRNDPLNGRLCTVFQNLPPRDIHTAPVDEKKERELFMKKLDALAKKNGWDYEVCEYKVWDDYMPTLPAAQSAALEKAQNNLCTHHFTSVLRGGFEDVEKSFELSIRKTREMFGKKYKQSGYPGFHFRTPQLQNPAEPLAELRELRSIKYSRL